ncbi:MAG: hypothetical protein QNJ72_35455 [Pleurocapsa sp. MO_226.B13]|nr:hypothetical protein [Pleurocapsa sp. MO_226.B13]
MFKPSENNPTLWVTRSIIFEKQSQTKPANRFCNLQQNIIRLQQDIIRCWLEHTEHTFDPTDSNNSNIQNTEALINKKNNEYSISWLNYLFTENVSESVRDDAFDALYLAQYYYGALECLNDELHKINTITYNIYRPHYSSFFKWLFRRYKKYNIIPLKEKISAYSMLSIKKEIDLITIRADMLISEYFDVQRYLKRSVRSKFNNIIVENWQF